MKIGIFIKDFERLEYWELMIIQNIMNNPSLKLNLLIKDGRINNIKKNSIRNQNFRLSKISNLLGKVLFKLQLNIEKKIIYKAHQNTESSEIISYLENIPTINLKPIHNGNSDVFSEEDVEIIKSFNLDILFKHEFNTINGDILNSSKYGVWVLSFSGLSNKDSNQVGLREIIMKQSFVIVSLFKLTQDIERPLIIDKAYYNLDHHFSFFRTNILIKESSVSFLFKNLKELRQVGYLDLETLDSPLNTYNPVPNIKNTFKYLFIYYNTLFQILSKKIFSQFGKRYECWTLFIGNGDFLEATLNEINPIKLPKGVFWADPFLFKYKDTTYVFFENFPYSEKKGKISCGVIKNNEVVNVIDILDLEYHLSYPFVFEEDGEIYLMPETSANNRLEIYKCINFPKKWELFSTAFEGEHVVDAFFYNDSLKQKWLFINKMGAPNTSFDNELYIYKVDSIKLNLIEPHKQNPVIIDSRVARNGGDIFKYKNEFYRPSQRNTDGIYGKALNINKIEKLSLEEYSEKTVRVVEPNFRKGLMSMHHLHQIDDSFVFDAGYRKI